MTFRSIWLLSAGAVLFALAAAGIVAGWLMVRDDAQEVGILQEVYLLLDPVHPGRGISDYPGNTVEDIPKSYAMILKAELERSRHGIEPSLPSLAETSGRWLLDNSRLDATGLVGWGVPVAWDAYGDDSVNPASTVYAISTAIVVDALLDWMETTPSAPGDEILEVVQAALVKFAQPAMRTPAGLLPYSLVATDRQYDTFNSAAYLAGQMQRFAKYAGEDAAIYETAADDTVRALVVHHQESPGGSWYWRYSVQEDVSNDLAHASYIVGGLRTYIEEGGALAGTVNLEAATGHLAEFVDGITVRAWPRLQENITGLARLYDVGMAMSIACREPALAELAARLTANVPLYRTETGFSRYPPVPEVVDYVVNEYEAYLWRGLISCEVATMLPADVALQSTPRTAVPSNNVGGVPLTKGGMLSGGVVLEQLDDGQGGVAIVRGLDENSLRIVSLDEAQQALRITHSEVSAPDFRAAALHKGELVVIYYDNPAQANYVARYARGDNGYALAAAPFVLPSFEDPAGGTYEMIPAVFLMPSKDRLFLVAGNLDAELGRDGVLTERRLDNCSRAVEAVAVPEGPVALCVQMDEVSPSAPFTILGPEGVALPSLGHGVPYNLHLVDGRASVAEAISSADLAAMFRFDLERLNGGWLEYGIDNIEGRVAWSQIYYLNGFLDLLELKSTDETGKWADFADLTASIRARLDMELSILNDQWFLGRYRTRAFSVDRSEQLFAVQTARLLLLFDRYLTEVDDAYPLPAFESIRAAVNQLAGHIEVSMDSGEQPWWLPPGDAHLVWPKGSAFYFDGLNVPFNHQNEWVYALRRTGSEDDLRARDITAHFLRRIAPDGVLPQTGKWDYWWGRAYDGWTSENQVSKNMPDYPGDHGAAWISFRSIDTMSVLAALPTLPKRMAGLLAASASALVQDGKLYPFVSYELRRAGLDVTLNDNVARRYVRVSSPWEIGNAVWAYKALLK